MGQWILPLGASFAGLAVLLGAFAAHALKAKIGADALQTFEVAVRYQTYHAFALLIFGLCAKQRELHPLPAYFFVAGIILFSGSLYGLALTGIKWLGAITPIGGGLLISGWALFAWGLCRR